jgi:hypothetical protein
MIQAKPVDMKEKSNKWTRRLEAQKEKRREHKIIINSGATSHFMSKKLKLPNMGQSNRTIYLPNNAKLKTSNKTQLPFKQLSDKAREADVLLGLKRSLMSINKVSQEGYTTVFHPGEEGVRSNRPQRRNYHHHNQQTASPPKTQNQTRKIMDSNTRPRTTRKRRDKQRIQSAIHFSNGQIPPRSRRIPNGRHMV